MRVPPLLPALGLVSLAASAPNTTAAPGSGASGALNLVPLPTNASTGTTVTCLSPEFSVALAADAPADLRAAADRMLARLRASRMRYLSPSYGAEFFANATGGGAQCAHTVTALEVSVASAGSIADHAVRPVEDRQGAEDYALAVPVDGAAHASAHTALGAFRALTSFEALWYKIGCDGDVALEEPVFWEHPRAGDVWGKGHSGGHGHDRRGGRDTDKYGDGDIAYAPFAPYAITDTPAFPWRSVLLDTSRHYFAKAALLRLLDTMARVKLSVFHWHITDSQSWPLALSGMPELAARGAYQPSRTYSDADVREVVAYAAARGIDVVVEIDTPGHTDSLYYSHPDFIACHEASPWATNANEPPAGQLRFADPQVADFVSEIFAGAIGLTSSAYFGTGGDELNANCMMSDNATTAILAARNWTLDAALAEFTRLTHGTLRTHERTPMVWEEMVLAHGDLGLDNRTVVDVWISSANARAVADKGFRIVHASSDYFYLDCGHGGWVGLDGGGNSWCDRFKSWQRIYSFDPFANLTDAQRPLVLGGQTSLWCEQCDATNYETIIWPRAAAAAELWWTGASGTANGSFPRSSVDAFPRMHDVRYRLVDAGVAAVPLQPEWCALRPHMCDLSA